MVFPQILIVLFFISVVDSLPWCVLCTRTSCTKGGEIRDTKTLDLSLNIVSLQVLVDVSRFSPYVINLSRIKNICCGLKKVVAKSRARVNFERQILALLLVFIKLATCRATNLLILRDKLRVFVSRISLTLEGGWLHL